MPARDSRPVKASSAVSRAVGAAGPPGGTVESDGAEKRWEGAFQRPDILRWVYMTRIGLAAGLFSGAALAWAEASASSPAQTLAASLALILTLTLTPLSYWFTHVRQRRVSSTFVYAQALFDVLLLTLVVHLTGGSQSVVAPFYILLISGYTLMLPLRGGFIVAAMACIGYIADVAWFQAMNVDTVVALQLTIFVAVALVVGLISTKLSETGAELTSVERELHQLRLDTGDILRNITTAVITVDGEGALAYANPAAERLLHLEAGSWLNQPVLDELGRVSAGLARAIERTRRHRMPVASAEIEVVSNGESVPVGISTTLLEREEGAPSVTAIMRDITDRKRWERLRQRTERLEAVAELSASLAHEIKNPLASISSSVQQLGLKEHADEDDRLLSGLILKESDRLSRLLSDFIDFARVQMGKSKVLDLREIATHALGVVRQHPAYRPEIKLEARLADVPVLFDGDEDLIHRVVTNLVLNAVQSAPVDRPARVEVDVWSGDAESAPEEIGLVDPVILKVSDDGPGISEDDLDRIFDPFFSKRPGGSGLGLAIVHRAVREHRGTILVESSPDRGTHFTVCLPRATAKKSNAQEK